MRTIQFNNVKYEYTYRSSDLFIIMALMAKNEVFSAASYCAEKLLRQVEDNEANALLRFNLGTLILQDIQPAMDSAELAKNVPAPSAMPATPIPR
jgi:hypothetical protein